MYNMFKGVDMNIFVLDRDPLTAAVWHCDKHVVKMIIESGQMLSTAHWVLWLERLGKTRDDFKLVRDMKSYLREHVPKDQQPEWQMTHRNHPCSIWVRETVANYFWTIRLMRSLLDQYTRRYKKKHKAEWNYKWLKKNIPSNLPNLPLTEHPVCMPDDCKISDNVVICYQEYYRKHKRYMAKWKTVEPPWWNIQV